MVENDCKSKEFFSIWIVFFFLILFVWKRWKTGGNRIQLRSVSIVAWKWACIFQLFLFLFFLIYFTTALISYWQFGFGCWTRRKMKFDKNNWLLLFFVCLSVCLVRLNERAGRFKRGNSTDDPIASCSVRNGTLREARRWEVPSATTPTERSSFGSNVNR